MRLLIIAILMLLNPVLAQTQPVMPERPFYLGVDALGVHLRDDDAFINADSNDAGARIYGGYLGPNRWAAEVSLIGLGRFDTGTPGQRAKFSALAVSALRFWPVGDSGRVFLRAGIGGMEIDVGGETDSAGMLTFGLGGELHLQSGVFLRGAVDWYGAELEPDPASSEDFSFGLGALSLGMAYAF